MGYVLVDVNITVTMYTKYCRYAESNTIECQWGTMKLIHAVVNRDFRFNQAAFSISASVLAM